MTSPELYEGLGYDLGIIVSDVLRGVPDPQAKNQWECPRCHGKLIHVEANDSLIIRDAFGMHGFSGRNLNGLPTRGVCSHGWPGRGSLGYRSRATWQQTVEDPALSASHGSFVSRFQRQSKTTRGGYWSVRTERQVEKPSWPVISGKS
jgi:hypothetical protein